MKKLDENVVDGKCSVVRGRVADGNHSLTDLSAFLCINGLPGNVVELEIISKNNESNIFQFVMLRPV